jgi:hypothetical protein
MAKLYTPEEIEALILAERKATIDAIGRIPYGDIATTCFRWYYNTKDAPPPLQKYIDDTKAADAAAEAADKEERGMNWRALDVTEHTFPAGNYYIGDPCFVLSDTSYDAVVCDGGDGFHTNGTHTIGFFSTAHGDGCYRGTNGESYGVDAGIIGIVPAELMKPDMATKEWGVITFENEFKFGWTDDATFYVKDEVNPANSFRIPTADDEEDEDEDEDEDSE